MFHYEPKKKPEPKPCEFCGEMIRIPKQRTNGTIECEVCSGDKRSPPGPTCTGDGTDRMYHGNLYHRGEW